MDVKCVRVLRPYEDSAQTENVLFIDDDARESVNLPWGSEVSAEGRRVARVVIQPLRPMDQQGFIARASQKVIDALYIEYGEEILLQT